jgi:hypothetical protein
MKISSNHCAKVSKASSLKVARIVDEFVVSQTKDRDISYNVLMMRLI